MDRPLTKLIDLKCVTHVVRLLQAIELSNRKANKLINEIQSNENNRILWSYVELPSLAKTLNHFC